MAYNHWNFQKVRSNFSISETSKKMFRETTTRDRTPINRNKIQNECNFVDSLFRFSFWMVSVAEDTMKKTITVSILCLKKGEKVEQHRKSGSEEGNGCACFPLQLEGGLQHRVDCYKE